MLKVFKNKYFPFLKLQKQTQKSKGGKSQKKEKLLLLMPENIRDRKLIVCNTIKYQLNIEKKVYGVSRIKYFKRINLFNWPSILHIPFDEYKNFRHFHLTIIGELFKGRSMLRNLTLITSHLTVLQTNNFTIDFLVFSD